MVDGNPALLTRPVVPRLQLKPPAPGLAQTYLRVYDMIHIHWRRKTERKRLVMMVQDTPQCDTWVVLIRLAELSYHLPRAWPSSAQTCLAVLSFSIFGIESSNTGGGFILFDELLVEFSYVRILVQPLALEKTISPGKPGVNAFSILLYIYHIYHIYIVYIIYIYTSSLPHTRSALACSCRSVAGSLLTG